MIISRSNSVSPCNIVTESYDIDYFVDLDHMVQIANESFNPDCDEYCVTKEGKIADFFRNIIEKIKGFFRKIRDFFKKLFSKKKDDNPSGGGTSTPEPPKSPEPTKAPEKPKEEPKPTPKAESKPKEEPKPTPKAESKPKEEQKPLSGRVVSPEKPKEEPKPTPKTESKPKEEPKPLSGRVVSPEKPKEEPKPTPPPVSKDVRISLSSYLDALSEISAFKPNFSVKIDTYEDIDHRFSLTDNVDDIVNGIIGTVPSTYALPIYDASAKRRKGTDIPYVLTKDGRETIISNMDQFDDLCVRNINKMLAPIKVSSINEFTQDNIIRHILGQRTTKTITASIAHGILYNCSKNDAEFGGRLAKAVNKATAKLNDHEKDLLKSINELKSSWDDYTDDKGNKGMPGSVASIVNRSVAQATSAARLIPTAISGIDRAKRIHTQQAFAIASTVIKEYRATKK